MKLFGHRRTGALALALVLAVWVCYHVSSRLSRVYEYVSGLSPDDDVISHLRSNLVLTNVQTVALSSLAAVPQAANVVLLKSNLLYSTYLLFNATSLEHLTDADEVVVGFTPSRPQGPARYLPALGLFCQFVSRGDVTADSTLVRFIDFFQPVDSDARPHWHQTPTRVRGRALYYWAMSFRQQNELLASDFYAAKNDRSVHTASKLKVMQVSDTHFDDTHTDLNAHTISFVTKALRSELPSLIIFNGDLINYSANYKAVLVRYLSPVIALGIPYIFTFGESDADPEYRQNRRVLAFIAGLPFCLNSVPRDSTYGLTNYNLKLFQNSELKGVVSLLDSRKNEIKESQVYSLYNFNNAFANLNILKLAFFHYPLPNFRPAGKFKIVGQYIDKDPLKTKTSPEVLNDFISMGYNVISVSHEHHNDGCILSKSKDQSKEIWLCYSSVAGFNADTNQDFDRKVRMFEISENRLLSWKVGEKEGKGFEYQLLS